MGVDITLINRGTAPNDGTGESPYSGAGAVNDSLTNLKDATEELQGRLWTLDNTAKTLVLGERIVAETHAGIIHTLPAVYALSATDFSDIWINNSDSNNDITLTPATGDELFLNGTGQGVDATIAIKPGELAICIPRVSNASWDIITLSGASTAVDISIATGVGSPTVDQVQEYIDNTGSSGYFLGGALSDGGAGTLDVAAGSGFIRTTNDTNAELQSFKWSASTGILVTDNTTQYVYVDDAGAISLNASEFLEAPDLLLIGAVTDEGGAIESVFNLGVRLEESIGQAGRFIRRVHSVTRDKRRGGLIFGQSGDANRDVTMSAGILWWGRTEYSISAINTTGAGDTFPTYSAGGQENAAAAQWPNAQYDNAGTLTTMGNNKWANLFFFIEPDDHIVMIYGRAEFNSQVLAEGEAVPVTSLPSRITQTGIRAARFTFQKSSNTAIISISADFDAVFVGVGVTDTIVGISGTKAEFNTAVTDGDFLYVGDAPTSHTIASHDTDTTGAELTALADNSTADGKHWHSKLVAIDGDPNPAFTAEANGDVTVEIGDLDIATAGKGVVWDANSRIVAGALVAGGSQYIIIDSNNNTSNAFFRIEKDTQTTGSGTELFTVFEDGNIRITAGNLIIDTAGKGIDYTAGGGTVLTDYDEGDHVATVTCSAGGGYVLDAAEDTLAWTKIGRDVHIKGVLKITSGSSPNGQLRISLPHTIATLTDKGGIGYVPMVIQLHTNTILRPMVLLGRGNAYVDLWDFDTVGVNTTITNSDIDTTFQLHINFSYVAA